MTTVANVIDDTLLKLHAVHTPVLNRLSGAITSTATTLTFEFATQSMQASGVIEIDSELLFVLAADRTAQTATVVRGFKGTTAAAHVDDSIIEMNPRFPRAEVLSAAKSEILSWGEKVWRVLETPSSITAYEYMVDLPAMDDGALHVLGLWAEPIHSTNGWASLKFVDERALPKTSFVSGRALRLKELPTTSRDCTVTYACRFDASVFTESTDLENRVGLKPSMLDIIPLGAAWRLLTLREAERTFNEPLGESSRAADHPPMHVMQIAQELRRQRNYRLGEEALALAAQYEIAF